MQGVKPRDIKAALGIDDAEMARLRQVARAVPEDVILAIGRAPKAGRPRWLALATAIEQDSAALGRVRGTLSADKAASSNERFQKALEVVLQASSSRNESSGDLPLRDKAGDVIGKAVFGRSEIKLRVQSAQGNAFAEFLRAELPGLMDRFAARNGG